MKDAEVEYNRIMGVNKLKESQEETKDIIDEFTSNITIKNEQCDMEDEYSEGQ